ncbi:hypothetical protein TNCV_2999461 [Trichonephila clavipes]|nr:hypothetical protein TNCV_2999461 [Trichonephila clavipes]
MDAFRATGNVSKERKGHLKTVRTSENVEQVRVLIQTGSSHAPTNRKNESGENKDPGEHTGRSQFKATCLVCNMAIKMSVRLQKYRTVEKNCLPNHPEENFSKHRFKKPQFN